jgi:hypothetical protein
MKIKMKNDLWMLAEEYKQLIRPIYLFLRGKSFRYYQEINFHHCESSYSFEGKEFRVPSSMDQNQYNIWFCKTVDHRFSILNPAEISEITAIIEDVAAIVAILLRKSYQNEKHISESRSMATYAATLQHTPDRG